MGRTNRVATGYSSTTTSYVDTVYDTCGCTPTGKAYKTSLPYVPGNTPAWKANTYDAIGRTLTRVAPDGASTITYSYAGNTVTVTDAAGKWKQYTTDAFGELIQVTEPSPNPSSEPNHVTTYTYDLLGHMTQAQMSRTVSGSVVTQTRTWTYDPNTQFLTSVTQPESGTVTYTYNSDGTVATKTDAKNQRIVYTYDAYQELTQVSRGTVVNGTFTEDTTQRTTYTYGSASSQTSPNSAGRIATIAYSGPANSGLQFTETYGYVAAGGISSKALGIQGSSSFSLTGTWAYDNEGRVTTMTYPSTSNTNSNPIAKYTYAFDALGRLNTMTDQNRNTLVSGVTYNAANQILSIAGTLSETRTYNANSQLIELVSGNFHFKYNYSANQNNGRITSMNDVVSGETIAYQYDSLNRLINASGTSDPQGNWSQAFTFDGFGNLTQKTSSNAPALSMAVDPTTNRIQTNGSAYDANGNLTAYGTGGFAQSYAYDIENRLNSATVSGTTYAYAYDSLNQRVFSGTLSGSTYTNEQIYFYGADGKKLGVWSLTSSAIQNVSINQWFGGRLLKGEDRLQSVGKYFPYGEDRYNPNPANPANDQEKFATYTRDSATGLDYALNRYYSSTIGKLMSVDPSAKSAKPKYPQTYNRYPYAGNDPVQFSDPTGLLRTPGSIDDDGGGSGGGDPWDDGSGWGGDDPCDATVDTFASASPYPNPNCYGPVQTPPPPTLNVQCDLQLFTQPAGSNLNPFVHTYIGLLTKVNGVETPETYWEAGPVDKVTGQPSSILSSTGGKAWLDLLDKNSNHFSHAYGTTSTPLWQTGFSQSNCVKDFVVGLNASRFPNNKITYGLPSPSSNTFTYSLLTMSGISIPWYVNAQLGSPLFGPVPGTPRAPGWGVLLKW